jgi:predicted nucleic-acid-binding protein
MKVTNMMKAIDTNVLVRVIVNDDRAQGKKALAYIKEHQPVFIGLIVLCEFCWVSTACYKFSKSELIQSIENILRTDQFIIENSDLVWSAIQEYRNQGSEFSDCLIAMVAKHQGSSKVGTFDKKASHSKFFELIE